MRTSIALVTAALVVAMTTSAGANLLYYEPFDYPPGLVDGSATDWTGTGSTATFDASGLSYPGLKSAGGKLAKGSIGPVGQDIVNNAATIDDLFHTAGTYYVTFLSRITTGGAGGLSGLGVLNLTSLPNNAHFQFGLQSNGAGTMTIGFEVNTNHGFTGGVNVGTDPFMVAMQVINGGDASADPVKIVINPDLSQDVATIFASPAREVTNMDITRALPNDANIRPSRNHDYDEIRVATTWAAAIPEPASLALLSLGGLAMLRRRRA